MTQRREFLETLGMLMGAMTIGAAELQAAPVPGDSPWDTSWLDALAAAQFRVVFNASEINDGTVMDQVRTFLDHFHDVHGTADAQTRAVIVFRRLGAPMAFNDAMWDRYAIGEDIRIADPGTRRGAKRNLFWRAAVGASPQDVALQLETLQQRGAISLVCSIATNTWAARTAARLHLDADAVASEIRANLIPGAILVPSGIYALIRAQNAGCAYMPGA